MELVEQITKDEELIDNGIICGCDNKEYGIPKDGWIGFLDSGKMQGVYFCVYSGMVDSSSGFLYAIEEMDINESSNCEIKIRG